MNYEQVRILNNVTGEKPYEVPLCFRAYTKEANKKLDLIKDVMLAIASKSDSDWPDDETWSTLLPHWFVNKIKSYSLDEIKHNGFLWDFGSWLDAMKFRGWEWFSSQIDDGGFLVRLQAIDFPYSVNPLEYIIYETGIKINDIVFNEDH